MVETEEEVEGRRVPAIPRSQHHPVTVMKASAPPRSLPPQGRRSQKQPQPQRAPPAQRSRQPSPPPPPPQHSHSRPPEAPAALRRRGEGVADATGRPAPPRLPRP